MTESNEGSAWFWKIFGGTILGMITFLLLAHINNINNSIDRSKNEAMVAVSLLRQDLATQRDIIDTAKDRLLFLENSPFKLKIENLELTVKDIEETVKLCSERLAGLEISITHFKEEIEMLKKTNEKLSEQLLALRDRVVALEQKKEMPDK